MATIYYTDEHEWLSVEGDTATVGITNYAQEQLGDLVFVELPDVGKEVSKGDDTVVVESVKAVSDLFAPVSGEVVERNDAVIEAPESLNDDVYDDGWMLKVRLSNPAELDGLMKKADYEALLEQEAE